MATKTQSRTQARKGTYRDERGLHISPEDMAELHRRVRERPEGTSVMAVCEASLKDLFKGIKGVTARPLYQQVYLYNATVPAGQSFVSPGRSAQAVKSADTRAAKQGVTKRKIIRAANTATKRNRPAAQKRAARSVSQNNTAETPVTQLVSYVGELEKARATAEQRAAAAEKRAEQLAAKLDRIKALA